MMFKKVMSFFGMKEIRGSKSNPKLLKLIQSELSWANDDSAISWCAIFGTVIFRIFGLDHLIPDKPYAARSWLKLKGKEGVEVIWEEGDDIDDIVKLAKTGDIVIFWRGRRYGWKGHFAWYINEYDWNRSKIRTIGGNQDDGVLIRPYAKSRILAIFRVKT